MTQVEELTAAGKLLEAERADFGVLFRQMDAFVVHGGLGTTVEALRMRKPTAVTGILLMDQRFWGLVCHEKGCGPKPVHIESFKDIATDWADRALDPESDYSKAAAALDFGDEDNDGVTANVNEFVRLIESGVEKTTGRPRCWARPKATRPSSRVARCYPLTPTRPTRRPREAPGVAWARAMHGAAAPLRQ